MQFKNITIFGSPEKFSKYGISPIVLGVASFDDIPDCQNIVSSRQDYPRFSYESFAYIESDGIDSLREQIALRKDKVEIIYFTNCIAKIFSGDGFIEFIRLVNRNRFIKLIYFHDTVINIDNIENKISESNSDIKFAYFAAWDVAERLKLITEKFFITIFKKDKESEKRNLSFAVEYANDQKAIKQQGHYITNIEKGNAYGNWEFMGRTSVHFNHFTQSAEENNKKLKEFINVKRDTEGKIEIDEQVYITCFTLVIIVPFSEKEYPHRWLFHDKNIIEIVRKARVKMQHIKFIRGFCASWVNDSTLEIVGLDTTFFIIFPIEHYLENEKKSIENIRNQAKGRMIPTKTLLKNESEELKIDDSPADDLVVNLATYFDKLFVLFDEKSKIVPLNKSSELLLQ